MLLLILLIWLPRTAAAAETVLIPSPAALVREYQARLQGTAFVTPSEAYTSLLPQPHVREALLAAYADAQKAFLENSLTLAQSKFEGVVAKLPEEDWDKNEREVFLVSFLRLAQMDSSKRDAYLAAALQLGPGLKPDKTLFPPPLLSRLEHLHAETPKINPRALFDPATWQKILINGVPCTRQSCPEFVNLPGPVRVTFLSDKWVPQTKRIALADLPGTRPEQTAWLQGACGKPIFHARAEMFDGKTGFWGLACAGLDLKPAPLAALPVGVALPEPVRETRTPLYKNKWVWAGAAAVTAAIIISVRAQKKGGGEERQTSTAYGF